MAEGRTLGIGGIVVVVTVGGGEALVAVRGGGVGALGGRGIAVGEGFLGGIRVRIGGPMPPRLTRRRCKYCRHLFHPARAWHVFHTPACRAAWYTAQWQAYKLFRHRKKGETHDPKTQPPPHEIGRV